jgi:hypothetical protein
MRVFTIGRVAVANSHRPARAGSTHAAKTDAALKRQRWTSRSVVTRRSSWRPRGVERFPVGALASGAGLFENDETDQSGSEGESSGFIGLFLRFEALRWLHLLSIGFTSASRSCGPVFDTERRERRPD